MKTNEKAKDLLTALEISLGHQCDEVPKGYRTIEEWRKIWGRGRSSTKDAIKRHVDSGRMERKDFRVKAGGNQNRVVPHYKAIK